MDTLSRARPKELAHDYLERAAGTDLGTEQGLVSSLVVGQWEREKQITIVPAVFPGHERPRRQTASRRGALGSTPEEFADARAGRLSDYRPNIENPGP